MQPALNNIYFFNVATNMFSLFPVHKYGVRKIERDTNVSIL